MFLKWEDLVCLRLGAPCVHTSHLSHPPPGVPEHDVMWSDPAQTDRTSVFVSIQVQDIDRHRTVPNPKTSLSTYIDYCWIGEVGPGNVLDENF